jgi:hypothetical protein
MDSSRELHEVSVYALKVPVVQDADGEPHVHVPQPPGVMDVPVVCACGYAAGQDAAPACAMQSAYGEGTFGAHTSEEPHVPCDGSEDGLHVRPDVPPGVGGVAVTFGVQLPPDAAGGCTPRNGKGRLTGSVVHVLLAGTGLPVLEQLELFPPMRPRFPFVQVGSVVTVHAQAQVEGPRPVGSTRTSVGLP